LILHPSIDLSGFDKRYKNDLVGALAFPPAKLLKVVLLAYSQGIVSSRGIEPACREYVTFIALCGDSHPHFTTISNFVSTLDDDIAHVFGAATASRGTPTISSFWSRVIGPVNEQKSRVAPIDACMILGFTFRRGKLRWSEAAFEDFKHHVRKFTGRSWGLSGGCGRYIARPRNGPGLHAGARPARGSMSYRYDKLAQYVRGWMGYFGISQYYRPIPELDEWLRRRARMCYWKQWRWARTKVRNLMALGTSKRQAILTAISSKSYWHLSRTLATQTGMTNDWLYAQGLVNIRGLWMKAQGYA
jgi:RNA-directed DNA polymerase